MTLLNQLKPEDADKVRDEYAKHTEVLRGLQITAADEASKYLWASNGGAAVALLAFMNANVLVRESHAAKVSLSAFIFGIVTLGVLRAINYHGSTRILNGWIAEINLVIKNKTEITAPATWLEQQIKNKSWVPTAFGYASFLAFIFGVVWGAYNIR